MSNQFIRHGMKKKTINAVLKKKFKDWVSSINDEALRKRLEAHTIITGGCIASMLLGEPVNDFDVYFTDKETTLMAAEYYVGYFNSIHEKDNTVNAEVLDMDKALKDMDGQTDPTIEPGRIKIFIQSNGVAGTTQLEETQAQLTDDLADVADATPEYLRDIMDADDIPGSVLEETEVKPYRPVFLSSNAITLSNKIQLIIRFYGEPDEIHKNYDFCHCTNFWTPEGGVVFNQKALEDILSRSLTYQGSKYPLCSIIRLRKFIKRGWQVNAGQMLKIMFQISNLDLTDLNVLEDQLIGVDTSYFSMLIEKLKKTAENKDDPQEIDHAYIISVIDRIFE